MVLGSSINSIGFRVGDSRPDCVETLKSNVTQCINEVQLQRQNVDNEKVMNPFAMLHVFLRTLLTSGTLVTGSQGAVLRFTSLRILFYGLLH